MSDFFSMAAAPPLRVGDAVVVLGLASAQEHNGATGTVVDVGAERCAVEVRHGEAARRLNVKPRHLRAIERPVLFSAREFERADPLSPALFAAVANAFAAREPWALPASSETVVAAELLDARGTILRRLCCAFEPGPEDRQPELAFTQSYAPTRAAKESEIPNFKGSYLGRFPLVLANFWTSDHLSKRSRSVDTFSGTRARETFTLKRR